MRGNIQVLKYRKLAAVLAALLVVASVTIANTAWAITTIVQDPNEKWLAFEAEDYHELIDLDGDGVTWTTIDDVDASGGKAIEADAGVNFDTNEAEAVYNVKFTRPDFYGVYARYKNLGISGNNDSFWSAGDLASFPTDPLRTWFSDSPAEIPRTLGSDPNELADPVTPTPEYFYARIGLMSISFGATDAGQVDEVLQFRIGIREQGSILDRIVIADASSPGPVDQTPNGISISTAQSFQLDAITNSPVVTDMGPGEFDGDTDVDGADFLVWQRGDSPNGIGSGDLAIWQSNFGNGTGPLAGVSAIPEPGSCLLLLVGSVMFATRRRR